MVPKDGFGKRSWMRFNWKDAVGLSSLIFGFILSGVIINQNEKREQAPPQKVEKAIVAKKATKKKASRKKARGIQSVPTLKAPPISLDQQKLAATELKSLMGCYYSESCDFPNNDPRQYKLEVGQKIKSKLHQAHLRIQRQQEPKPENWATLSAQALTIEDGHVKQAALEVLSNLEPNPEAFEKILKEVLGYHDASLIPLAMAELQKYEGTGQKQKIYATLAQVLQTGSLMVRKEVINHLDPWLNKKSLPYFETALKNLNPDSNIHSSLYKMIKEYQRQSTGA